jgi:methanogenic corrinoid protein MtbC1
MSGVGSGFVDNRSAAVLKFVQGSVSMIDRINEAYREALLDTDRDRALSVIHEAVAHGLSPEDAVFKVVIPSIDWMIRLVTEKQDVCLAQHFLTSQIAAEVVEEMTPRFQGSVKVAGHVVMGTSVGDFHGLGKKIVIGCLKALLIDVSDLGLNVAPERFVDDAVARGAEVIGISSMMVHTARGENGCLKVRRILKERGLEDRIRIDVGGAPYRHDPGLYKTVCADAWAENGITASRVIADLIQEVRR